MDLYVSTHVFMGCVIVCVIMYMCICCVRIHLHKHENALSFLWMRKLILANGIYVLWDFALGATSWSCVGATSWGRGRERCKVPRMAQSSTLQDTYFIEGKYESLKAIERVFYKFVYSISKWSWHIIHLHYIKVCMHFCITKTSLPTEFCNHYSLFWFSFQNSGLIRDEWEDELELRTVDGLAKFLNYFAGFCIWGLNCYQL